MMEHQWLIDKAMLAARGVALANNPEDIREMQELLDAFSRRMRDKQIALLPDAHRN